MRHKVDIEANEIEHVAELSYYNNIVYKLKRPTDKWTHVIEHYDDVSEMPDYYLGTYNGGKFQQASYGYGDPIPRKKLGVGGVWIEITLE